MKQKFKIIFAGTPTIACDILEAIHKMSHYEIVLIISQPNRAIGRHQSQIQSTSVATWAQKNNIKLLQPFKIKEIKNIIETTSADAFITCAYGQIIPQSILNILNLLFINIHMSLLPQFRGAAPIIYAIWKQLNITGVSLMKMVAKMDAGPIYCQKSVPVNSLDNQDSLTEKLIIAATKLINDKLPLILKQEIKPISQNENQVTFAPSLTKADEKIDWTQSALSIESHIRAFSPSPIVFSITTTGTRYKFWASKIPEPQNWQPAAIGEVILVNEKGLFIMTGKGVLQILTLQKAGRKPQPAHLFKNLKGQHFIH